MSYKRIDNAVQYLLDHQNYLIRLMYQDTLFVRAYAEYNDISNPLARCIGVSKMILPNTDGTDPRYKNVYRYRDNTDLSLQNPNVLCEKGYKVTIGNSDGRPNNTPPFITPLPLTIWFEGASGVELQDVHDYYIKISDEGDFEGRYALIKYRLLSPIMGYSIVWDYYPLPEIPGNPLVLD